MRPSCQPALLYLGGQVTAGSALPGAVSPGTKSGGGCLGLRDSGVSPFQPPCPPGAHARAVDRPQGGAAHLPALGPLFCLLLFLSQPLSHPEVSAGAHSDGSAPASCPDARCSPRPGLAWLTRVQCLAGLSGVLTCVLFCFLHVQFCKANSRYCISQLICLQHKLTVSLSATTPTCGFTITTRSTPASNSLSHFKSFASSGAALG